MDWLFPILAIACLAAGGLWFWRRRKTARGSTCWNCGADLSQLRLYVDYRGQARCPKCRNEIEER